MYHPQENSVRDRRQKSRTLHCLLLRDALFLKSNLDMHDSIKILYFTLFKSRRIIYVGMYYKYIHQFGLPQKINFWNNVCGYLFCDWLLQSFFIF